MRIFASCFYISSLERYFVPSFHLQPLALNDRQQYLLFNCSLYQQQHALARHEAGDQPTEGVRIELSNSLVIVTAFLGYAIITLPIFAYRSAPPPLLHSHQHLLQKEENHFLESRLGRFGRRRINIRRRRCQQQKTSFVKTQKRS